MTARLLGSGAVVTVFDPIAHHETSKVFGDRVAYADTLDEAVDGADAILVMTRWAEFEVLRRPARPGVAAAGRRRRTPTAAEVRVRALRSHRALRFIETPLQGAWIVDLEPREDDRGFFARAFDQQEFDDHGIASDVRQANISLSHAAGTVRGLHFQYPPAAESKFVRCIAGAVYDVIVDVRPGSPTFLQHVGVELSRRTTRPSSSRPASPTASWRWTT